VSEELSTALELACDLDWCIFVLDLQNDWFSELGNGALLRWRNVTQVALRYATDNWLSSSLQIFNTLNGKIQGSERTSCNEIATSGTLLRIQFLLCSKLIFVVLQENLFKLSFATLKLVLRFDVLSCELTNVDFTVAIDIALREELGNNLSDMIFINVLFLKEDHHLITRDSPIAVKVDHPELVVQLA